MLAFAAVETYAALELEDLPETRRELALAFILSVWACNAAMAGDFQLSQYEYRTIQNTGMNAARMLSNDIQDRAGKIIDDLVSQGLIRPGASN